MKAANDNFKPGECLGDRLRRIARVPPSVRWPLEAEHRAGRVSVDEMMTADAILGYWEGANRPVGGTLYRPKETPSDALVGAEHRAHNSQIIARLADACGHLWAPVLDAVVFHKGMREIGFSFDAANDNAAAIGRHKAVDGLKLAGRELLRIAAEKDANDDRFGLKWPASRQRRAAFG